MQADRSGRIHKGRERIIGGVCSGLAEYLDIDPLLVRAVFAVLAFAGGSGVPLYVLLWLLMPEAGAEAAEGPEAVRRGLRAVREDINRITEELRKPAGGGSATR